MELKEFIKATITTIAESIEELNDEIGDKVMVNPKNIDMIDRDGRNDKLVSVLAYGAQGNIKDARLIQEIEFNLAISEAKVNDAGGGLNIKVFSAEVNKGNAKQNANTVKFTIPVAFLK